MVLDADTATVVATLAANSMFGAGILLFFELSRDNRDIYSARLRNNKFRAPGRPPVGFLGWIGHTLAVTEEDTLSMIGMDAFIVLRFTKLCARVCVVCCLGAAVMMPLYHASNPQTDSQEPVQGINTYTMANLPLGGNKLYCATCFSWFYSMLFVYLIKEEYAHFVYLRQRFMASGDPDMVQQRLLTIKVENIPSNCQSDEKLWNLFNDLFPNEVYSASCCQFAVTIDSLIRERDNIVARFEVCLGQEAKNDESVLSTGSGIMIDIATGAPPALYGGITYSKAIQFFCSILIKLNNDISGMQDRAHMPDGKEPVNPYLSTKGQSLKNLVPVKELFTPLLAPGAQVNEAANLDPEDVSAFDKGLGAVTDGLTTAVGAVEGGLGAVKNAAVDGIDVVRKHVVAPLAMPVDLDLPDVDMAALAIDYSAPVHGSTGFITFRTRRSHALAYQVAMLTNQFPDLIAEQALEPRDIVWHNITVPHNWNIIAKNLTSIMYYSGMIFWTAVLAFIAALSNLDNISQYVPALNNLDPVLYAFVAGLLPVVVLMLFLDNLPIIMGLVSEYFEKLKSRSDIARQVFKWFFYYQLSNIYLLLITGSVASSMSAAIDDPMSIFYLLGAAIPSISLFFTNYMITTVLFGVPFQLLVLFPQLTHWFYSQFADATVTTRRQILDGPLAAVPFEYGANLPNLLYVLCIVMTYWTMCPLLSILGALYFCGLYIVYKHQFLYVYTREYETGGMFFYQLFDSAMLCLVISCALMTAYVSVSGGIIPAALLFPLPITVWYCWCNITNEYEHRSANMAYNCAVSSDENHQAHSALLQGLTPDCYKQPCMKPEATEAVPFPHRLEGNPLLVKSSTSSKFKTLHSIYYNDLRLSDDEIDAFYRGLVEKYFPPEKQQEQASLLSSQHSSRSLVVSSVRSGGSSPTSPTTPNNNNTYVGPNPHVGRDLERKKPSSVTEIPI